MKAAIQHCMLLWCIKAIDVLKLHSTKDLSWPLYPQAPPINSSTTASLTSWTISYTCFSSWSPSCPSGTITSIPPSSSSYSISGLVKGSSYTFVVGGVNSGAGGDLSPPATNQTTADCELSDSAFSSHKNMIKLLKI